MEKIYVAWDDLWPYVQKEYEKADARDDLEGRQWCNYFLMLISCADHKKIKEEN